MDMNDILEKNTQVLEVTENSKKYLKTTASWTMFMAVLGFIYVAFLVLGGIITMTMGGFMASTDVMPFPGLFSFMGVFYFLIAIVAVFPALFLLRFSQKTTKALINQDTLVMEDALKNMKAFWKFTGIMIIVMFALVIITIPILAIIIGTSMM